jgi:hypothetical protein
LGLVSEAFSQAIVLLLLLGFLSQSGIGGNEIELPLQASSVAEDDLDEKILVVGLSRAGDLSGGSRLWPDLKVANSLIEITLSYVILGDFWGFKCAIGSPQA